MSSERRAIYVDEKTFEKLNFYAEDFKSPTHFIKHLLQLYERMLTK